MPAIQDIIRQDRQPSEIISDLSEKTITVPIWKGPKGLSVEYDPKKHPVMNRAIYPDVVEEDGTIDRVTRVPLNFQKLAVKRMTELCCGIPVKRVYSPDDDQQKEVSAYLEKIFIRNRIFHFYRVVEISLSVLFKDNVFYLILLKLCNNFIFKRKCKCLRFCNNTLKAFAHNRSFANCYSSCVVCFIKIASFYVSINCFEHS